MPLNELKRAYYERDQGSSIFTDLQEQLGMKLQREKAPINVMVVDFVAKASENQRLSFRLKRPAGRQAR